MKTVRNALEVITTVGGLLVASHYFTPNVYAHIWQYSGDLLPISAETLQSCPSCYLGQQERKLQRAKGELRQMRQSVLTLTQSAEQRQAGYDRRLDVGEHLLQEAKQAFQQSPAASHYYLAGKRLSRAEFDAQVQFTAMEVDALKQSKSHLASVRGKEKQIWAMLAKGTADYELKAAQLASARIEYETTQLIGQMDLDFKVFAETAELSKSTIRDLEEVLSDREQLTNVQSLTEMMQNSAPGAGVFSELTKSVLGSAPTKNNVTE